MIRICYWIHKVKDAKCNIDNIKCEEGGEVKVSVCC